MLSVGLNHFLVLSALLFAVGLYTALARGNAVVIMMGIEIMLNAVNLTLVAFSRFITPLAMTGQVFALFIITVAAAEAAVGLALIIAIYRRRNTVDIEQFDLMKG